MARLKRLAVVWQVSQAEVVRRSVAQADALAITKEDRASALRTLHRAGNTLVRETAEEYLEQAREARHDWRGER